ncbi:MAG: hypothetical protein ACJ763_19745 [Bdellovibrionia bacterium]
MMKTSKVTLATWVSLIVCSQAFCSHSWAADIGSSFNEVRDVIKNPYPSGQLPQYQVTVSRFVKNGVNLIQEAAVKTVNDRVDYYPRLDKLIHSNGICFTGEWRITEANPYSGYFKAGSRAPMIARISTATSNTLAGEKRGFGFAGKLFPTSDLDQKVETANFFTVDVLTGTVKSHFQDTALTNEPPLGFNLSLVNMLIHLSKALSAADHSPMFRPLYEISEAGRMHGEAERTPHWIQIRPSSKNRKIDETDFRNELDIAKNHPEGLVMEILVSDTTKDPEADAWSKIGVIHLAESFVSYGCDRQLHFHHPKVK